MSTPIARPVGPIPASGEEQIHAAAAGVSSTLEPGAIGPMARGLPTPAKRLGEIRGIAASSSLS